MTKYFDPKETLIASELWDLLSGEPMTMEKILKIINDISTPSFMETYRFLNDPSNREADPRSYKQFLKEWHLYSEMELLDKINTSLLDNRFVRIYNQKPFDSKGCYNVARYVRLRELI